MTDEFEALRKAVARPADDEFASLRKAVAPQPASLEESARQLADDIWEGKFKTRRGQSMSPFGTPLERETEAIQRLHGKPTPVRPPDPNPIDIDRFINQHVAIGEIEKAVQASGQRYSDPDFRRLVRQRMEALAQQKAAETKPDTATKVLGYVGDRLPFAGHPDLATTGQRVIAAEKAVQSGRATQQDYNVLAQAKEQAEQAKHEGVAEKTLDFVSRAPGFIGENIASGGLAGQTILGGVSRYAGNVMAGAEPSEAGKALAQEAIANAAFKAAGGLPGLNTSPSIVTAVPKLVAASNVGQEAAYSLGIANQPSAITRAGRGEPGALSDVAAELAGFGAVEAAPRTARSLRDILARRKPPPKPTVKPDVATSVLVPTEAGSIPKELADILGLQPVAPEPAKIEPRPLPIASKPKAAPPPSTAAEKDLGDFEMRREILKAVGVDVAGMSKAEVERQFAKTGIPLESLTEKPVIVPQKAATYEVPAEAAVSPPPEPPTPPPPPPAPPVAPPPPAPSMLDRIRARQAGQLPQAKVPIQPTLREPPPAELPPMERLRQQYLRGEKVDIKEVFQAANLTPKQQDTLLQRFEKTQAQIASEQGKTRQAVEDVEKRALKRLGASASVESAVVQPERLARALELIEKQSLVEATTTDPVMVGKEFARREAIERKIDTIRDTLEQELANGPLTPERQAYFEREYTRAVQELESPPGTRERRSSPLRPDRGGEPESRPSVDRGAGPATQPAATSEPAVAVSEAKPLKPSGRNKALEQQAIDEGFPLDWYRAAVEEVKARHAAESEAHNEFVREARYRLGSVAKVAHLAEDAAALEGHRSRVTKGGRAVSSQSIDEAATDMANSGKTGMLADESRHGSDVILEKIKEGIKKPLTSQELHKKAMEMLYEARQAEEATKGDAYEGGGGGPEFTSSRQGELPGDVPFKAEAMIRRLWGDDRGSTDLTEAADNVRELTGQMFPRTTRLNRESGEAMARKANASVYGAIAAKDHIKHTVGKVTDAEALTIGAVATELHLRNTRSFFARQVQSAWAELSQAVQALRANPTDPALMANMHDKRQAWVDAKRQRDGVTTVIGAPDSPFQTDAEYQQALASPLVVGFVQKYVQDTSPVVEGFYRDSLNLPPGQPTPVSSQIPGFFVNLLRKDSSAARPASGKFQNLRQRRLPFARQRTGSSEYNLDIRDIIRNTFEKSADAAARTVMDNTLIRNRQAVLAPPGTVPDINGEPVRVVPFTKGNKAMHVLEPIYKEYVNAINPTAKTTIPYLTKGFGVATKAAIASSVEVAYHGYNLVTGLFNPGMVRGTAKSLVDRIVNSKGWDKQITELARIGAQKSEHSEVGTIASIFGEKLEKKLTPFDPTYWGGRLLHATNNIMRVGADNAFDLLAKKFPDIPNTETNRRNFINQNLGQYNRAAQHVIVQLARDTGFGPFATAGTTMTARSIRMLTGGHGVQTGKASTDARLRAEVYAKVAATLGATAAINYLAWGNPFGDDDTPFGSIKVGESEDGKAMHVNLPGVGSILRGLRATGLRAVIEGIRRGDTKERITDRAAKDVGRSIAHPFLGPIAHVAEVAMTGKNYFGQDIAGKAKDDESQTFRNIWAALKTANPIVSALTASDQSYKTQDDVSAEERLMELLGPFGIRYRKKK